MNVVLRRIFNPIRITAVILLLCTFSASGAAEDAYIEGLVIHVPVAVVQGAQYRLQLTLVLDSNPITLTLTGAEEISGFSTSGASTFAGTTLSIPALQVGDTKYSLALNLSNDNPIQFVLASFAINGHASEESAELRAQALELFTASLATPIVNTRCIACHVEGGLARDTSLIFQRTNSASTQNNFEVFSDLLESRIDGVEYILSKVTGNNHTGGIQLPNGTAEFATFQEFLTVLDDSIGKNPTPVGTADFFGGVTLLNRESTLRRAATMLASRLPTEAEINLVRNGNDANLRTALRGLMQGDGFHRFLLEGTNDRLLTEGVPGVSTLDPNNPAYPAYTNESYRLKLQERNTGEKQLAFSLLKKVDTALKRAPGELVAYIAANELPYSEILTADYEMMNPYSNFALGGDAVFTDQTDENEFHPGKVRGYYHNVESRKVDFSDIVLGPFVEVFGDGQVDLPHAGVLTNIAFLSRYPTTATNRNRARARWTFFHFLDIDIEKSSQRPTDPEALADTNNPTMNNPNCAACHATMDPVAGVFQNWDETGHYKSGWMGLDSLDRNYKFPPDGGTTLYQQGDTWYRDMRSPGLFDSLITDKEMSLRKLAQLMVQEPAFARAAVKFWWPSVIGSKILRPPAVVDDSNYQAQLLAYEAQSAAIDEFAADFATHMNLKDLLVEMLMSPWFGTAAVAGTEMTAAHTVAELGVEKLLTPERLHRKTLALTGFGWETFESQFDGLTSGLEDKYGLYYGGIDSFALSKRATELTPLMSTVAMVHALESAGPIVLKEFILSDDKRKLFSGITDKTTPLSLGGEFSFEVSAKDEFDFANYPATIDISAGNRAIAVEFLNSYCDYDEVAKKCLDFRNLVVSEISVRSATGSFSQSIKASATNVKVPPGGNCGYQRNQEQFVIYGNCAITVELNIPATGSYVVTAKVAAFQGGSELARFSTAARSTEDPLLSTASGAIAIKQKLIELHQILHGKTYSLQSDEIQSAYTLLTNSWLNAQQSGVRPNLFWNQSVDWWRDYYYANDTGFSGTTHVYNPQHNIYQINSDEIQPFLDKHSGDPSLMKHSWRTVLVYLMTHYDYLYE